MNSQDGRDEDATISVRADGSPSLKRRRKKIRQSSQELQGVTTCRTHKAERANEEKSKGRGRSARNLLERAFPKMD